MNTSLVMDIAIILVFCVIILYATVEEAVHSNDKTSHMLLLGIGAFGIAGASIGIAALIAHP